MHKLLFLDFDGVLNNKDTLKKMPICNFHSKIFAQEIFHKTDFNFTDEAIKTLQTLYDIIGNYLTIVIASNWQLHAKVEHFVDLFQLFDIKFTNIKTMTYDDANIQTCKSNIIEKWLEHNYGNDIPSMICLDDRPELYSYSFRHAYLKHIDPSFGLQMSDLEDILCRLNK